MRAQANSHLLPPGARPLAALVLLLAALAVLAPMVLPSPASAADSGLPVPRFVSLRADKVNVRTGPGVRYPVEWVLQRRGMPVEVVAEYDIWRKVRDVDGTVGWVLQSLLSSRRGIVVTGAVRSLRREPKDGAPAVAQAEPDVIGQLLECKGAWCRANVAGFRGWLKRSEFWGVYPNEKIE